MFTKRRILANPEAFSRVAVACVLAAFWGPLATVPAAEPAPAPSWRELVAEGDRLGGEFNRLCKENKLDDAIPVAEAYIATARRLMAAKPTDAEAQKSLRIAQYGLDYLLKWLVNRHWQREDWPAAIRWQREMTEFLTQLYGKEDYRTADARREIGFLERLRELSSDDSRRLVMADQFVSRAYQLKGQGSAQAATPLAEEALQIRKRLLGAQDARIAMALNLLGQLQDDQRNYAGAETLYRQASELWRNVLGESHPSYATSLSNLAGLYYKQGHFAQAEPLYHQVLKIRKEVFGENSSEYVQGANNLAFLYQARGDYAQAEPIYRQVLEIRKKLVGEKHTDYAASLINLAYLYQLQREYARAEPLYREAAEIWKKAAGENQAYYATALNNLPFLYQAQGDYARAEPLYRQVLEIRKKALGENHPDYLFSLNNLAGLYQAQRDFARAEPLLRQVLEIRRKVQGENHPDYATSLQILATLYYTQGDYALAESLYRQALEKRKTVLGENHSDYAISLRALAVLYEAQGEYARAEPLYRQALEIRKKVLGENHPEYATSLVNLAVLYQRQGAYARAEPLLGQAREIRKKVFGENHPNYAASLESLGSLCVAQGEYARAEPFFVQALEIRKKALGENHPDYASSLSDLAALYKSQGDYARAEPLYRRALDIREKALGQNHPDNTYLLNSLALLYQAESDYTRAEPLLRRALEIRKNALGENHPDYATSLHNLAFLFVKQGDYARAEPLYRQASALTKKILGEKHTDYATTLANLAQVYYYQADYARAEPLYRQAMEIDKKALGENHPSYAIDLQSLAWLYQAQGDYARAEPFCRQALEIRKKALGENHPDYAGSLASLARLYQDQGDYARAEPLYRQAVMIQFRQLEATAAIQSQRQQFTMLNAVRSYLNGYLALTAQTDQFSTPAYQQMLAWKGMVFRRERLSRAGEQTPELAALFRQLREVAGQLANQAWTTPNPKQADRWREGIAKLSEQKEQLEAELSARSAAFRRAKAPATLQDIQAALPKDVVLVDFLEFWKSTQVAAPQRGGLGVRFEQAGEGSKVTEVVAGGAAVQDGQVQSGDLILAVTDHAGKWTPTPGQTAEGVRDLIAGEAGSKITLRIRRAQEAESREVTLTRTPLPLQRKFDWHSQSEYVAFVVPHEGPVTRINLGPTKPLNEAIDAWRESFGISPQSTAAGKLLREKLWEPIAPKIPAAATVLVSPDGALSRIPLGALPGKEPGTYLLEERTLAVVPVPQMIPEIVQRGGRKQLSKNLLLVGNVDYDAQPGSTQVAMAAAPKKQFGRAPMEGLARFDSLEGTQGEIATIEKLYRKDFGLEGITTLEQAQASKQAFLRAAAEHRYLHLATHGFFAPENREAATATAPAEANRLGQMLLRGKELSGSHPGLLSGLALAGANRAGTARAVADAEVDDGILTAEEIGAQNLDGVQLVMLSACETGLGKVSGGEGLLGLQRAFQAAGAETVVASLWKVPDGATRDLMERFYEKHWQKNMGILPALREAQLSMLREGGKRGMDFTPGQLPDKNQRLPPYYWAAFVLSGDWR